MAAEFPKVAAKVWQSKLGASETALKKLTLQLEEQTREKSNLLELRTEREISAEEFQDANSEWKQKIFETEERIRTLTATRATRDSFVRFAELQLTDLANVWRIANPEQRERVQNLLFGDGLDNSPESGLSNRSKSSLFFALCDTNLKEVNMVREKGLEPPRISPLGPKPSASAISPLPLSCPLRTSSG